MARYRSEVVETYPDLRAAVVGKLIESLDQIKASQVYRAAIWIIGEYSVTPNDIDVAFTSIKGALGQMPLLEAGESEVRKLPLTRRHDLNSS